MSYQDPGSPREVRPGHGQGGLLSISSSMTAYPKRPATVDRRRLIVVGGVAALLEVAQVQLQMRTLGGQRRELVVCAPLPEAAQILPVRARGRRPVPGEEAAAAKSESSNRAAGRFSALTVRSQADPRASTASTASRLTLRFLAELQSERLRLPARWRAEHVPSRERGVARAPVGDGAERARAGPIGNSQAPPVWPTGISQVRDVAKSRGLQETLPARDARRQASD